MPIRTARVLVDQLAAGLNSALEPPGRVALSWSAASGLLAGGAWVAMLASTGRASASTAWFLSTVFFVVFGILGFVHGAVLGYLGRDREQSRWRVLRSVVWAAVLGAPVLALMYEIAIWLSMTEVAVLTARPSLVIGVSVSWLVLLAVCTLAVWQGAVVLRRAYAHWPECRLGTLLLAVTFAFLLLSFLSEPPAVWGSDLRVKGMGALLLAAGVTAWIASPVIVIALHAAHRRLQRRGKPALRVQ
jgi:hypothetical protein